ncbi:MAG: type II toxin-antitoxin system VapC family toxin [Planctomycetaceae bacterium]
MLVLDTDHLIELDRASEAGAVLREKLEQSNQNIATTIISAEEQFRGWLAQIHGEPDPHRQIAAYERLNGRIEFFAAWNVLPWTVTAADKFTELRKSRVRIGTIDLKIASIVLANDAILLSRNVRDIDKVPGLRFEDWLS